MDFLGEYEKVVKLTVTVIMKSTCIIHDVVHAMGWSGTLISKIVQ